MYFLSSSVLFHLGSIGVSVALSVAETVVVVPSMLACWVRAHVFESLSGQGFLVNCLAPRSTQPKMAPRSTQPKMAARWTWSM